MATPQIPSDFFTPASIGTFTGATGAVWILGNTLRKLTGRDLKGLAFVVSLVVAYVAAYAAGALSNLLAYFLVFLNGCLLFMTAGGVQGWASESTTPTEAHKPKVHGRHSLKFLTPWFK
jgi:zinc transporter ZupT